jgi:spore germination protein GerM
MKREHLHPSFPKEVVIGIVTLCLAALGGMTWWVWQFNAITSSARKPSQAEQIRTVPPAGTSASVGQQAPSTSQNWNNRTSNPAAMGMLKPQVYWLQVSGSQVYLAPQASSGEAPTSDFLALEGALTNLFKGTTQVSATTAIPDNTQLNSLRMTADEIYIDLSREFKQGGGSSGMIYRAAQVLYTATSLNPTAKVFLSIEGQALDEDHPLGGEGISLPYPVTRETFNQEFLQPPLSEAEPRPQG